jgi:hypothetical protein
MTTKEVFALPEETLRFIEPMYATPTRELPDGNAWAYEAKAREGPLKNIACSAN